MSSYNQYSYVRCYSIVQILDDLLIKQKLPTIISFDDIYQLRSSCTAAEIEELKEMFSKPMVWIGIYIAVASLFCILAMAADLLRGFRNKKFWFPCKYFSLNAASITLITVAMKLTVDLSGEMPTYLDQATKVGSLAFMCTMMANLLPSLASMDNKTLLANIIGLCILVITMIVNVFIQINTGVIDIEIFSIFACIYMAMILLLLTMMISSSLTIPSSKEILESKYLATKKVSLPHERLQHNHMSKVDKLRQHVRRHWVMAETGSPQFVIASNPISTASGVISLIVMVINLLMVYRFLLRPDQLKRVFSDLRNVGLSSYKWSTPIILLTQSIGVVVGTIAPISRCFTVFNFKLDTKWNRNYFMVFKVEEYWTQKLREWKQSPILFLSSSRSRAISLVYNIKGVILSICIKFQKGNVILCKVILLVASIFVVSCLYCWKSLKAKWFTPPNTLRSDDIDKDLRNYILQIENEMELSEKIMRRISNSLSSFVSKAEREQNNNLLELLENSSGFTGVEIFDTDNVQPLLPVELVNSWSLPIVTLTCIAVSLPNMRKEEVESFLRCVTEGISFAGLVDESLGSASGHVTNQNSIRILWHEVEHKRRWLDNPLVHNVFKRKTAIEIVEWFSDKAKQIVSEIKEGTLDRELAENPPPTLIAANSMYRITQTILLRYQSNIEPITKKQLFANLKSMIADIFSACFTNIPRAIKVRCNESVIEKREASVKVAAKLLGKTTKIIERLETCEVPNMDDDKLAYIDDWRLYLKQSVP